VPNDLKDFVDDVVGQYRPLYIAHTHAIWDAATKGSPASNQAEKDAHAALLHFWADKNRFLKSKQFQDADKIDNTLQVRQAKLIFLAAAGAQQDKATIAKLTQLEADVRLIYYNFRGKIDGKELSDNELDAILSDSSDIDEVRQAWEASKQVGVEVASSIRELARVRNKAARVQGYRDFFEKSLVLSEIVEEDLLQLFAELEEISLEPFQVLKAEIDEVRAEKFGIEVNALRPWHYGDPFFQEVPKVGDIDGAGFFAEKDPVDLSSATYDGIGLEVRDILLRSDLYAREGKNQHAFCIDMDHEGDIRTLNNLESNRHWNSTLLHELGHAVYDKYVDRELPWMLRTPAHTVSTEAIAIMMGSLVNDRTWLTHVLNAPQDIAHRLAEYGEKRERSARLIFTRWCLVMTYFERSLYQDPDQDLNQTWWDLVERFQLLRRPDNRDFPDWAAKIHIALYPVYYQNYEIGYLVSAQWRHFLEQEVGGFVGEQGTGQWLVDRVFQPGAIDDWTEHIVTVTGEPLSPKYFVDSIQ
jgi:peptidyl-dipeptidase A